MDDLISRPDAIDLLDEQIAICNRALTSPSISMSDEFAVNVERNSLMAYRDKLECMPSAQPERKKGKWIRRDRRDNKGKPLYGWYQCSECGAFIGSNEAKFCSECGADMRENEQE